METRQDHIMPAISAGPDSMDLNPFTLSFPGDLESLFMEDYYQNSLTMVRLSLFAGMLLYGFFGILDAQLVPGMKLKLWAIRFTLVWPALLGVVLFSYSSHFKKYFQISVAMALIVAGFAIIYMISIIPPPVNYSYYAGLILVFIWGYTFGRIRFIYATSAGWFIVAFYEFVAGWMGQTPAPIFLNNNFFFISANLVGMFACYSIEYYARRDFFLAYLLEKEQQNIISANRKLERIVHDRTAQLTETNRSLRTEIDERKRAEEKRAELEKRLQQAQKMESLGTLAGGIAHDFNNLLMGIQGYSSLMLLDMDDSNPDREKLKNIEQYVVKGADLTRQLLGFARGGKYEVKPTDLNDLINKSTKMFGRTKKEVAIIEKYEKNLWTVDVDRGQIEQVLLNLFLNAWQAMPGGGQLFLETANLNVHEFEVRSSGVKPGRYVQVKVRDTGVGMDEKTRERIFEPFFTTREMGRGTGLGLASAYGIVKSHGGIITVNSVKGQGSTFCILFPASDQEVQQESTPHRELVTGSGTILLVDDEKMIRDVGVRMLKRMGYKVLEAGDGREALDLFRERRNEIDMVILDMIMPGLSGSETYDRLKEENPSVKVLLASGYSLTGEAAKIMERGCNGFIQKPFDMKGLSHKIHEVLHGGTL